MRAPRGYLVVLTKCLLAVSVVVLMLSIGGYVMWQMRDVASVATFDPNAASGFRAYGEVPIPGTQTLHLPAGKVAITFHAETVGVPEAGLPIPELKLDINPPEGVADPKVTESSGGTTSFNNDAWRQVWIAEIPQDGDYQIVTDGQVTAFVSARLAFGKVDVTPSSPSSPAGNLVWVSQIAFAAGLLTLIACILALRMFAGRTANSAFAQDVSPAAAYPASPATAVTPPASGTARRLEELEMLRDSGAISDAEYAARREQIIAEI